MLIQNAEVYGECLDVRLSGENIVDIGRNLRANGECFNAQGHALLPGLHDHHIHLNASAAAMNSVHCGPPEVTSEGELIDVLHKGIGTAMLRGISYHQSVAGEIDRSWLDRYGPNRPIRIQHRSGRLWILNSLAMEAFKLKTPKDGRLLDEDYRLRGKSVFPDLKPLISKLISYGITGVTEVTPSNGIDEYENYIENAPPLRLNIMGKAELNHVKRPYIGPLKLHYHDHNLPSLEDLRAEIQAAHKHDRAIAAHCVTRAELMLTLAAIEEVDAHVGDRIEHAAIADDFAIEWMARLGVTVVTQPNFIAERAAAYRQDVEPEDHPHLWRLKSFIDAGLNCTAGSDAPFGNANPWAAMGALYQTSR